MWVNLWISDHWQVENHKAKVDAIEDMFVNRKKKWWNESQCIKATQNFIEITEEKYQASKKVHKICAQDWSRRCEALLKFR